MKRGKIELPDGTVCKVLLNDVAGGKNPQPMYQAPKPWINTWFVVPADKRNTIQWS